MLMQVLSLTQEQIDALAETERSAIMQLVRTFIISATHRINGFFSEVGLWAL